MPLKATHRIDFLDNTDKHNPFAKCNRYAKVSVALNDSIYNAIVNYVMHCDLFEESDNTIKIKMSNDLNTEAYDFLKNAMEKHSIEFKRSSKYFLQSAFAKIKFSNASSNVLLFFQLFGSTYKKVVAMTGISFMRCTISQSSKTKEK